MREAMEKLGLQVENYATLRQQHYGSGVTFTLNSMGGNAFTSTLSI